ncbi:hypothetical protein [Vandammella animalimorsus]|uniref:hypothetical protein n=1 Tax=Vandammella animalimorsus TaxID=2029117 RepID=UPI001EED8D1C|nr:hypothetical protein [Vandammella animalimorsus]
MPQRLLIAADIHGLHAPLRAWLSPLLTLAHSVQLLSPWPGDGERPPHASEAEAVAAFHAHQGLPRYAQRIAQAMGDAPVFLVAFSVGAASAWHALAGPACHPHSRAVLYYGSRIRDALTLTPRCPVQLVFAEREAGFEPQAIAPALAASGAHCAILPGTRHGFMNPLSPHFQPVLAQAQRAWLCQSLRRHGQGLPLDPLPSTPHCPPTP